MASAAYATIADLGLAIRSEALDGFDTTVLQDCLDGAADIIDGYLRDRFVLPLTSWDNSIRRCAAIIAVHDAMAARGYNAANAGDEQLQIRYEGQIAWLRDIASNRTTPKVIDSSPSATEGAAMYSRAVVDSNETRGYQQSSPASVYREAFQGRRR